MNTSEKVAILGRITTRDEAGRHFYSIYNSSDLAELEAEGLIKIYRPGHDTGIPYSEEYHSVELTDEGLALVEAG